MKNSIIIILFVLVVSAANAQPEPPINYQSLYATADSILQLKKPVNIDSSLSSSLQNANNLTPYNYFAAALLKLKQNEWQQAALLYYIGSIRQQYYISINADYAPNDDWQYAESMKAVSGKTILLFLKTSVDNYINILSTAIDYCEKNDYAFASKTTHEKEYRQAIDKIKSMAVDYLQNKAAYTKQWNEERTQRLSIK